MVKSSLRLAVRPSGLFAVMFCAALVLEIQPAAIADDAKPAGGNSGAKTPLAARIEAGADTTASSQDLPVPPIDEKHPLYLPLVEAYKARKALDGVKDYEAEFIKRELIGRKLLKTTMHLKMRHEPFSVYLKFLDANQGREVIYVEGTNNNKLFVHEAGFKSIAGTLSLLPTGPDAMADNRYPVTMIGLKTMVEAIIEQWEAEGKFGEVQTQKYPNARLPTGEECVAYESLHPTARKQFKYHVTRLWIDKKTGIAIRLEQLGYPDKKDKTPPVIEEYTYGKLRTNIPLSNADFSTKNPKYAFP